MGHSTVMLSTFASLRVNSAKHLGTQRYIPFAALRVSTEGGSLCDNPVMLSRSEASLVAPRARPFAALRVTPGGSSRRDSTVMLSAAKHLGALCNHLSYA
jgi:hypothetical protein